MAAWSRCVEVVVAPNWHPPPMGMIKVHFDVAVRPDFSVGAAVLHDSLGRVVGAKVLKTLVAGVLEGEVFAA